MVSINVDTKQRAYEVIIGGGLVKDFGRLISEVKPVCKAMIITDDIVNSLYGDKVADSIEKAGFGVSRFVFENGEKSKNINTYANILERLAEEQFTRTDLIVALGGGVVGDVSGFAAATYLRGIDFVQLPTTLLAAVDSSVGGKTGIDLTAGKNLAGAFWQPVRVLCDTDFLATLTKERRADGIAEIIKYGVICSKPLFDTLASGDFEEKLAECIAECVKIKSDIVSRDEYDNGERRLLNLGHTFGHAIEKASGLTMTHGYAVAVGTVIAAKTAEGLGISCPCSSDIIEALKKYELPVACGYDKQTIINYALTDKKRTGGDIALILPEKIGKCVIYSTKVDDLNDIVKL